MGGNELRDGHGDVTICVCVKNDGKVRPIVSELFIEAPSEVLRRFEWDVNIEFVSFMRPDIYYGTGTKRAIIW